MILYHGANDPNITKFDLEHSRSNLDFGPGVYLTRNKAQAEEWAKTVYVFDVDTDQLSSFEYKDEDLDYVLYLCRIGLEDVAKETIYSFEEADIIVGQMLKGNVARFRRKVEKFNSGDIQYDEFKKWVKVFDDKDQFCFKTQRAVDMLNRSFIKKYQVA